jgi:haloalkane dehalogenase
MEARTPFPKLFVNTDRGSILVGRQRNFCRQWANQTEIAVRESHFLQEDSPAELGHAIADFVRQSG